MVCKHCGRPIERLRGIYYWHHPIGDRKIAWCANVNISDDDDYVTEGPEAEPLEPVDVIKLLKQHGL